MTKRESEQIQKQYTALKPIIKQRLDDGATLKTIATDHGLKYNYLSLKCKEWQFKVKNKGNLRHGGNTFKRQVYYILDESTIEQEMKTRVFPADYSHGISGCMPGGESEEWNNSKGVFYD